MGGGFSINAVSSQGAAIGGGVDTGAKNIIIYGGNIYAESNSYSAAIGSGENDINTQKTVTAENIQILGGTVNVAGGSNAAAIGGGKSSNTTDIIIKDAKITAETYDYGAVIGSGSDANAENIRIENSVVYAAGQSGAAIIGGGVNGTGDKIYIIDSVVSLVQKNYSGPDMIGNGVDVLASNIYIDNSSVSMYSTSTFYPDISQNSPIKNSAGEQVYLLTVDNPDGDEVIVDGAKAVANNNTAADPSDTGLHLWLVGTDHSFTYMALSRNTICYSEGNDLYTISRDTGEKTLLYTAAPAEDGVYHDRKKSGGGDFTHST